MIARAMILSLLAIAFGCQQVHPEPGLSAADVRVLAQAQGRR